MARRLPSLNALRAFEAAARHASFTLAAAEMNVTHAAVSRHIRDLEAWLGAKLFTRTGRGVEPTENGLRLGRDLTPAFDALERAVLPFAAPRKRHQLVISSEVPFAALWLVPRLGAFTAKHPEIELILDPTNRLVDFSKGEADLGIRYGRGAWRGVEAEKLIDSVLTPVCSPALLKRSGIKVPRDLARATLLQDDPKQHWTDWLAAAGVTGEVVPAGPTLKGHLAIAAAEAGQGFALADAVEVTEALAEKRLVRPFAIAVRREESYYVVRAAGTKEGKAAAAFRTWLVEEVRRTVPTFEAVGAAAPKGNPRSKR